MRRPSPSRSMTARADSTSGSSGMYLIVELRL
jgi:hypothetical protein